MIVYVKQNHNLISIAVFLLMIFSLISICFFDTRWIVISMTFTIGAMLVYCLTNLSKNLSLMIFFVCFFTFLSSSVIIRFFSGENFFYGFNKIEFDTACSLIIVSAYMVFWGYYIDKRYNISLFKQNDKSCEEHCITKKIQNASFAIFVITTILLLFFSVPKMVYAIRMGYVALYTSYSGSEWSMRLYFMSSAAFFIGLAANPNKRRLWVYEILGCLNPIIVFIQGERSTLVAYVLFNVWYVFNYKYMIYGTEEKSKNDCLKLLLFGGIVMIFVLPFLYNYGYSRIGEYSNTRGLQGVLNFFDSQGGSFRVLGESVKYDGSLPQRWYSFGSIIDRLSDAGYYQQSEKRALMAHSFADAITYFEEKESYLSGYGMGSCYIGEIYYDFGVIGVVIVNYILGMILKALSNFRKMSIFKRSILFIVFQNMMIIPRGAFLRPIDVLLSSSTIIVFLIVFGISKIKI